MSNSRSYLNEMTILTDELSHLIFWRTNKGSTINQMYKLLDISRPSHAAYLKSDSGVPSYIWSHLDLLNSMKPHQRLKLAFNKLTTQENITVEHALEATISAWEKLHNRKMNDTNGCSIAGQFSAQRANKRMLEVKEQDPSGIAMALMLDTYLKEYTKEISFSFQGIYAESKELNDFLLNYTEAKLFLESKPLGTIINNFKDTAKRAIVFYKPKAKPSQALMDKAIDYMLSAKAHFKSYPCYQISSNALVQIENNAQLKIQEQIYSFPSISDLIDSASQIPNGFSLSLIRTPRAPDSFFCIIAKYDENIYLLTDKPKGNEFKNDALSSRSQRYNSDRFDESLMPYEMLDMSISNNGRDITMNESTELKVHQGGLRVLGHFRDMSNASLLWFTFLLEECRTELFSSTKPQLPALAYIDNSSITHALLPAPSEQGKQLPANFVTKSTIVQKSSTELSRDNFDKNLNLDPATTKKLVSRNKWMEDKFDPQIDSSLLYITDKVDSTAIAIEDKSGKFKLALPDNAGGQSALSIKLKRLPQSMVGTQLDIQREVDLYARYNKSKFISMLAKKDFETRELEVKTWLAKKVKANLPNLLDDLVSLNHERFFIAQNVNDFKINDEKPYKSSILFRQIHVAKRSFYDPKSKITVLQKVLGIRDNEDNAICFVNKTDLPEYSFYLNSSTIHDLMILTGLAREEFPIELQHWQTKPEIIPDMKSYRYDPIETITNPWDQMKFRFSVSLSKEFVQGRRKELGVKGRFIRPKNYFDNPDGQEMNLWLRDHPLLKGLPVNWSTFDYAPKPDWSFYTSGGD